jgi:hypothetical protein
VSSSNRGMHGAQQPMRQHSTSRQGARLMRPQASSRTLLPRAATWWCHLCATTFIAALRCAHRNTPAGLLLSYYPKEPNSHKKASHCAAGMLVCVHARCATATHASPAPTAARCAAHAGFALHMQGKVLTSTPNRYCVTSGVYASLSVTLSSAATLALARNICQAT